MNGRALWSQQKDLLHKAVFRRSERISAFNNRVLAALASIQDLYSKYRLTCVNRACIKKSHTGPCIIGKRRKLNYELELAHLQKDAEEAAWMRTLGDLLLLHDAELARLTQEYSMSWVPKANRFWTTKTRELRQQVPNTCIHFAESQRRSSREIGEL